MPTNLIEKRNDGFFIASEANNTRSREEEILVLGQNLEAGTVLGKITASGKVTTYDPGAADGSESVYGVLYHTRDATAADENVVAIVRDAEVNLDDLTWFSGATQPQIDTGVAELAALGIIARPAGEVSDLADQSA